MILIVGVGVIACHVASVIGQEARDMLELNGRVMDAEAGEDAVDTRQDALTCRWRHIFDQYVSAQRMRMRAETPDVKIVHVEDTFDSGHRLGDVGEFDAARQSFEQDIERFANDVPGRVDDERSEGDGESRVEIAPAGITNSNRAGDDSDGADGIAHHVNERGADIDVAFLTSVQRQHNGAVQNESRSCDPHHRPVVYGLRVNDPADGLPENEQRDEDQGGGVQECCDNARTLIAVGFDLIGWFTLQVKTDGSEEQSERVGKVVSRVREQRETLGLEPSEDFKSSKAECCNYGNAQNPTGMLPVMMMVRQVFASVPNSNLR